MAEQFKVGIESEVLLVRRQGLNAAGDREFAEEVCETYNSVRTADQAEMVVSPLLVVMLTWAETEKDRPEAIKAWVPFAAWMISDDKTVTPDKANQGKKKIQF